MLNNHTLNFLADLAANNEREWFHANKSRYEREVKNPFEALVKAIIERIQHELDPAILITPKQAIFRIYRDTRFSAHKTPYKMHVSAIISPFGTKNKEYPGFYLQVDAEKMMLGGGAYFLEKDSLHHVREVIAEDYETFVEIIQAPAFVKHYGEVLGEKNKRLPEEFRDLLSAMPLIANKQYYYMTDLPPETALGANAVDKAISYYKAGKPLSDFLAQALAGKP